MMRWLGLVVVSLALCSVVHAADKGEEIRDAARAGDLAAVKRLIGEGVDVNAATKYGATALAYASDKGHIDVVRYLLENGADVNARDTFYQGTPITWAIFSEHVEIIALLLENATGLEERVVPGGSTVEPDRRGRTRPVSRSHRGRADGRRG